MRHLAIHEERLDGLLDVGANALRERPFRNGRAVDAVFGEVLHEERPDGSPLRCFRGHVFHILRPILRAFLKLLMNVEGGFCFVRAPEFLQELSAHILDLGGCDTEAHGALDLLQGRGVVAQLH